ncbi:hypothetical protein FQN54_009908 [Arachnomyces sp. PD_36]|nr:hypothetical protein FQN54_009908 [Arachnomyces sp. PD_36]
MDNTRDQAARGRGLKRGVTTRSQGKNERLKDKSGTGPEGSSASAPAGILDANLHQLNLAGTRSTAPSELDIQTPISLSHATALTSTSISRDNASSRSHSPAKYIVDLGAAKPPIMVDTMDGAPEAIRILMDRFADVCDGIAVLPNCLKAQIKEINKREYRGLFFDDTTSATLSDKELLERLRYLQGAASRCHRLGKPEPSWGEEVFRPMLDLAVELENRDGGPVAQVENVTTAQIFPQYLVPINLQSLPFASKRVDYGIYLSQTDAQESFNREIFTKRSNNIEDHSINQAGSSNSIKWLPQLAAIECKKTLPGIDGVVQLGIWMAALRKRLEGLMKESQTPGLILKPMPCVKVEGLNWQMYWCCVGERGETVYLPVPEPTFELQSSDMILPLDALWAEATGLDDRYKRHVSDPEGATGDREIRPGRVLAVVQRNNSLGKLDCSGFLWRHLVAPALPL